jgi:hypothetical protein
VLFPVGAGLLMDRFEVGVPFWISGILVLATLPFAWSLAGSLSPESPATVAVRMVSAADVTGEFPVEKVAEEGVSTGESIGGEVAGERSLGGGNVGPGRTG